MWIDSETSELYDEWNATYLTPTLPAREAAGNRNLVSAKVIFVHLRASFSLEKSSDSRPSFSSCLQSIRGNRAQPLEFLLYTNEGTIAAYPKKTYCRKDCEGTIIGWSYVKLLQK